VAVQGVRGGRGQCSECGCAPAPQASLRVLRVALHRRPHVGQQHGRAAAVTGLPGALPQGFVVLDGLVQARQHLPGIRAGREVLHQGAEQLGLGAREACRRVEQALGALVQRLDVPAEGGDERGLEFGQLQAVGHVRHAGLQAVARGHVQ